MANTRKRFGWWKAGVAVVAVVGLAAATYAVLTAFVFSGCVDIADAKSYTITKLKHDMSPTAVSPNGEYIVGQGDMEANEFVLWHDGEYAKIKKPQAAPSDPIPVAVNDSGTVVVNYGGIDSGRAEVWTYDGAEFQQLKGPGERAHAEAINADGVIVGDGSLTDEGSGPLKWEAGESQARALELPDEIDSDYGLATDVSDDGVVIGTIADDSWLWDESGKGRRLAQSSADIPPPPPTITGDWAVAGNRKWNLAEDREYPQVDERSVWNAIDACGRMYGVDRDVTGDAVVHDTKLRKLPALDKTVDEHYPDVPEDPMGEVYEVSHDGSVLIGESKGWKVIWTYS